MAKLIERLSQLESQAERTRTRQQRLAERTREALTTNHPSKGRILAWLAAAPNRQEWAYKNGVYSEQTPTQAPG